MAHDDDRPGVDFVVGAPPENPDEELPAEAPTTNALRRTLTVAAVVLVGGTLLIRGITHNNATPSTGSSTGSAPSVSRGQGDDVISATGAPIRLPNGSRTKPTRVTVLGALQPCPPQAMCQEISGLPGPALDALRQRFPSIVLTQARSTLADRPGRFEPDLVSRSVRARAGAVAIGISIHKPRSGDAAGYHRGATSASATEVVAGFTVSVSVSLGHDAIPEAGLVALARDTALVSPQ